MLNTIDHVTVCTGDLDRADRFYRGLLGLRAGPRPAFAVPGRWLYIGRRPVVHLVEAGARSPVGTIDHVAFVARGRATLERRLADAGIEYRMRTRPDGSALQMFVRDPDGAVLELVFRSPEDR